MTEWDDYWAKAPKPHNRMYDRVAVFYRKHIIKPYLRYFFSKHFTGKNTILHAGCGGGQVEEGLDTSMTIIGMDISPNALSLYRRYHQQSDLVLGDIMNTGFAAQSMDGIYNLGVMEHFSEAEIHNILKEYFRILKPGGVVILFWPPRYGATVIFLKCVHFICNSVLKREIHLHPPEPTLIKSKSHAESLVTDAGFRMLSYKFGIADLFTYAVIVLKKQE